MKNIANVLVTGLSALFLLGQSPAVSEIKPLPKERMEEFIQFVKTEDSLAGVEMYEKGNFRGKYFNYHGQLVGLYLLMNAPDHPSHIGINFFSLNRNNYPNFALYGCGEDLDSADGIPDWISFNNGGCDMTKSFSELSDSQRVQSTQAEQGMIYFVVDTLRQDTASKK